MSPIQSHSSLFFFFFFFFPSSISSSTTSSLTIILILLNCCLSDHHLNASSTIDDALNMHYESYDDDGDIDGGGDGAFEDSNQSIESLQTNHTKSFLGDTIRIDRKKEMLYNESNPFPVRIVGIFVADSELPYTLELAKPSINIAIEKAKKMFPKTVWEDGVFRNGSNRCTSNFAGVFAAEEFYLRRVTVFIGPSCGLALDPVARMASHWRIPVISSGGPHVQFSNKEIFSTLTRLSFSLIDLGSFVRQIFEQFEWKHVSIIVQEKPSSPLIPLIKETIIDMFDAEADIQLESHEISRSLAKTNFKNLLIECSKESRILFILTNGHALRQILLAAYDLGMGKGSYVFLTVELFKHSSSFGNFDWFIENDDRNDDVKQMYETLFILTVHVPMTDIYSKFAIDVIEKSRKEFNTSFTTKDVNVILAGFHDSVIMYGLAVTETIEQGFDPMDGIEVTKRLWNRTFMNYLSGDIYINANGDKETDYTLEDFDPKSLRMRSVMYYSGRENKIVWLNLSKIHWPRNIIPSSDINVCYPDIVDLHCIQSKIPWPILDILIGVLVSIVFILIVLIFIYRKMRLESELTSLWWKIRWNEIIFIHNQSDRSLDASKSLFPAFDDDPTSARSDRGDISKRKNLLAYLQQQDNVQKQAKQQSQSSENIVNESKTTTSLSSPLLSETIDRDPNETENRTNKFNQTKSTKSSCSLSLDQSIRSATANADNHDDDDDDHQNTVIPCTTTIAATLPIDANKTTPIEKPYIRINDFFSFPHYFPHLNLAGRKNSQKTLNETLDQSNQSNQCSDTIPIKFGMKRHRLIDFIRFTSSKNLSHSIDLDLERSDSRAHSAMNTLTVRNVCCSNNSNQLMDHQQFHHHLRTPQKMIDDSKRANHFDHFKQRRLNGNDNDDGIHCNENEIGARGLGSYNLNLRSRNFESLASLPNKGIYKGSKLFIKHLHIKHLSINREILIELKQLKDLAHENLIRFVGICAEDQHVSILTEYCEKGNLRDLLDNEAIRIDWPFRYSLINDIVEGLLFIHESSLLFHGSLKSTNCVIDSRLVVKITDIGLKGLRNLSKQNTGPPNFKSLLWTAPEHLRQRRPDLYGSQKGDVYSFSIVLQEIITRSGPFETVKVVGSDGKYSVVSLDPQFIIQQLKLGGTTPYRPNVDQRECSTELIDLLQQCWDETPQQRPSFSTIKTQIKKISKDLVGGSGNSFLENLLLRLEQYANDLEILVEQKTSAFFEEKKKCEELLYELLPRTVADQLKRGNQVKPESFQCVTIFFSDIVQFTQIAAESTPIEIVDFLNDLYTLFDSIIASYDVYKVETVGDAYMVVSGLPIRNGNEHARQIARMSLELLDQIKKFRIKHLPNHDVRLRIGIHSGPCAAGVIGLKMPRYCLFGDTVNTASRMESHGEPNKIHTSEYCKNILDRFGTFNLTLRGDIYLKGKGIVRTYWLNREENHSFMNQFAFIDSNRKSSSNYRGTSASNSLKRNRLCGSLNLLDQQSQPQQQQQETMDHLNETSIKMISSGGSNRFNNNEQKYQSIVSVSLLTVDGMNQALVEHRRSKRKKINYSKSLVDDGRTKRTDHLRIRSVSLDSVAFAGINTVAGEVSDPFRIELIQKGKLE